MQTFESLNLSKRGFNAFLSNISVSESGCWLYQCGLGLDGYAHVRSRETNLSAARVAYLLWRGPIPEGFEPDHHVCAHRNCICPEHLELVTHRDNMRRGRARNKTATVCWRGHALTPENVRLARGWRVCIACDSYGPRREYYLKKSKTLGRPEHSATPPLVPPTRVPGRPSEQRKKENTREEATSSSIAGKPRNLLTFSRGWTPPSRAYWRQA